MSGITPLRLARNVCLAVVAGSAGGMLINTFRRDPKRAKKLLTYTAISGCTGLAIGYTYASFRGHNVYMHSLSAAANLTFVSGTFLVLRENILVYSRLQGNKLFLEEELPPSMSFTSSVSPQFASAASGGVTGILLSCFVWRGIPTAILNILQGIGLGVVGQWTYDKLRIWRLEQAIKYHYPELAANIAMQEAENKEDWQAYLTRLLSSKSYASRLNEKIQSLEIQLEILEEEEAKLLSKTGGRKEDAAALVEKLP